MKIRTVLSLLALSLLNSTFVLAQDDDDDDRPVVRKDRNNTSNAAKSIYGINLMHVTEDNVGFAISYEHFLDNNGIVSLYLPLSYSLPQSRNNYYDNTPYYDYNYNSYYYDLQDQFDVSNGMATFYPGIKIYPGGANKKVTYAVGSSLVFGFGSTERVTRNYKIDTAYSGGYPSYARILDKQNSQNLSRFKLGMLVTNYLNIRAGNKYYFGAEFGLGYSYFHTIDNVDADRSALVQLGIKIGLVK